MSESVATGGPLELTTDDLLPLRPWLRGESQPEHASFSRFVDDDWRTVTAREHLDTLVATTRGLIASGVEAGDRIALMSDTRYEWLLLDEAIWNAGGGTVPVYPSSSPSQVEWIVSDSGATTLIVETPGQAAALAELDLDLTVLVIDEGALDDLTERGREVPESAVRERRDATRSPGSSTPPARPVARRGSCSPTGT